MVIIPLNGLIINGFDWGYFTTINWKMELLLYPTINFTDNLWCLHPMTFLPGNTILVSRFVGCGWVFGYFNGLSHWLLLLLMLMLLLLLLWWVRRILWDSPIRRMPVVTRIITCLCLAIPILKESRWSPMWVPNGGVLHYFPRVPRGCPISWQHRCIKCERMTHEWQDIRTCLMSATTFRSMLQCVHA